MRTIKYTVYKDEEHYVSQCLNVDVASFGATVEEAVSNLAEALELYFEDQTHAAEYHPIPHAMIGEFSINA
jgi:predicted RNase H-like HicB family nuclease